LPSAFIGHHWTPDIVISQRRYQNVVPGEAGLSGLLLKFLKGTLKSIPFPLFLSLPSSFSHFASLAAVVVRYTTSARMNSTRIIRATQSRAEFRNRRTCKRVCNKAHSEKARESLEKGSWPRKVMSPMRHASLSLRKS